MSSDEYMGMISENEEVALALEMLRTVIVIIVGVAKPIGAFLISVNILFLITIFSCLNLLPLNL